MECARSEYLASKISLGELKRNIIFNFCKKYILDPACVMDLKQFAISEGSSFLSQ